jgi:long-chain acyl-CoA synthetase
MIRLNENKTLYEALLQGAAINEKAPALLYKGRRVSYKAFRENTDVLAAALIRGGICPGDVVAVSLPNIPKSAYLFYAINKIGAISYFMHALNAPAETLKGLKKTDAKILFTLDSAAAPLEDDCARIGVKIVSCCPADELGRFISSVYRRREGLKRPKKQKNGYESLKITDYNDFTAGISEKTTVSYYPLPPKKTAVLLDSGGTAGVPKTVELSAFAINSLAETGPEILCEKKNAFSYKYMLSPLPIFHCYGLTMGLCAMIMAGGCNVFMPRFSKRDSLKYLKRGKINYMIGVPAVYNALLTQKKFSGKILKGVDTAFVGGDRLFAKTKADFDARMRDAGSTARLFEGYGLSETLSVVCVNTHDQNRAGSVGKPIPGARITVIKTDEFKNCFEDEFAGDRSAPDKIPDSAVSGELCVGGKILMNAYYKDDAATENAFFTDDAGEKWLKTGDAGYIDADGFVYFLCRLKRIIKVSGESVFPSEIENAASAVNGVRLCAAYAVPDFKTGSRPALAVEAEKGADKTELEKALRAALSSSLQKNAVPKEIIFLDELPLTKMNKVDIKLLS